MTHPTCQTCVWGRMVFSASWGEQRLRCMRVTRFRNGDMDDPLAVGRDAKQERDSLPEPQRWPMDKCSVEGKHWGPRA